MKLLVFGGWGQFGSDLAAAAQGRHDLVRPKHEEVDVRSATDVERLVAESRPHVVLNAAAFHKVELCEEDPDLAFAVNATGARNVASSARRWGARCVYVSTDYVFDGAKAGGYSEEDAVAPLNVYGASKAAGETLVRTACPDHLVVRVSGLFGVAGSSGKGGNFVETMLSKAGAGDEISVVDDQIFAPTSTKDLAHRTLAMLERTIPPGTYHAANSGSCSWYGFARAIFEIAGIDASLRPRATGESSLRRPPQSILLDTMTASLEIPAPRPWREALEAYLQDRLVGAS